MKKTIRRIAGPLLGLAIAIACVNARAEWVEIERFEDNTRAYVDKKTVHREGDIAQVKHLVRWGEPQVDSDQPPYLSTVVLTAYDCVTGREKYLGSTSYAGAMGDGAIVIEDHDEANDWSLSSDDSMEKKLWRIACGID